MLLRNSQRNLGCCTAALGWILATFHQMPQRGQTYHSQLNCRKVPSCWKARVLNTHIYTCRNETGAFFPYKMQFGAVIPLTSSWLHHLLVVLPVSHFYHQGIIAGQRGSQELKEGMWLAEPCLWTQWSHCGVSDAQNGSKKSWLPILVQIGDILKTTMFFFKQPFFALKGGYTVPSSFFAFSSSLSSLCTPGTQSSTPKKVWNCHGSRKLWVNDPGVWFRPSQPCCCYSRSLGCNDQWRDVCGRWTCWPPEPTQMCCIFWPWHKSCFAKNVWHTFNKLWIRASALGISKASRLRRRHALEPLLLHALQAGNELVTPSTALPLAKCQALRLQLCVLDEHHSQLLEWYDVMWPNTLHCILYIVTLQKSPQNEIVYCVSFLFETYLWTHMSHWYLWTWPWKPTSLEADARAVPKSGPFLWTWKVK